MLTVYKASAGSGKTFRLAVEYIKQLIINESNYEHTLAVTFTNKATEEMKMRILSQLYGLAHRLESSNNYMEVIVNDLKASHYFKDTKVDEKFVAERAETALRRLLHDYSMFRVETIDRFFQTVLRNLARELDLAQNLRVELSAKEIEYKAVDSWIDSLRGNDKELKWIISYVEANMEEDKKWNVIDKIKSFGEQLLRDDYKAFSKQLSDCLDGSDQKFYDNYTAKLRKIISDGTKEVNAAGKELWETITANGYDEDSFTQRARGVGGFIKRMATEKVTALEPNSYVMAACNPEDTEAAKWTAKKAPEPLKALCREQLRPRFMAAMERFRAISTDARSAQVTLNHMSELRMLRAIQEEINRGNAEHDRFLLADTQTLLSRMIDGSDSPFIFEKIGARLHNIMIDEFQDTSRIQWQNFKVLLAECMSKGYDNLIVGDVKQSIYRWRSGDWRLLNNISGEFTEKMNILPLTLNRRSSTRIIDFNNAFFTHAAQNVYEEASKGCKQEDAEMLKAAYEDVCQQYLDNKEPNGYVEVKLLDKEDYRESTLRYVSDKITSLIEMGVKQKDIAVLVRNNKEIADIALHCVGCFSKSESEAMRRVRIVSDEGFLLKASPAVCIMVDAIRLLLNPDDEIVRARLSLTFQRNVCKDDTPHQELMENIILPKEYTDDIQRLSTLPLYQLCEELFIMFELAKLQNQSAYVCCFFDCVTDFLQNTNGDLQSFIEHWDERISKKSIESDSDDGIRILTIHKSKGLEYRHVIIPFCDWQLEMGGMMWCEPGKSPFNELPVIPLDYSKKSLINTIYEPYYWEEHLQNLVDNINLLYVAFTRAKDGLYVTTQAGQKENSRGCIIQTVLADTCNSLKEIEAKNGGDGSNVVLSDTELTYGEVTLAKKKKKSKEKETNVFLQKEIPLDINIVTSSKQPEFRQSNNSKEFMLTDEQETEQIKAQYIQLGNILHELFASIRTADDIPSALLDLEMQGKLYGQDITAEMLREHIENCLTNPTIADWFSDKWRIYNECTILNYDATKNEYSEHRPDRVIMNDEETIVIDFKLYSYKEGYKDQVKRYMEFLKKMGHKNVHGYIWMILSNKIRKI